MSYELLRKVDTKILQKINGESYVSAADSIQVIGEETFARMYFVRSTTYTVLDDFPVRGAVTRVSPQSSVEGPMEQEPHLPVRNSAEKNIESITTIIPVSSAPTQAAFTPVELREYGTVMNVPRMWYIDAVHGSGAVEENRLPLSELSSLGEDVLYRMGHIASPVLKFGESPPSLRCYIARKGDSLLELTVGQGKAYGRYPIVYFRAFGPDGTTNQFIRELGLERINDIFRIKDAREVGIENSLQRGLAFNINIDDLQIHQIKREENIIL